MGQRRENDPLYFGGPLSSSGKERELDASDDKNEILRNWCKHSIADFLGPLCEASTRTPQSHFTGSQIEARHPRRTPSHSPSACTQLKRTVQATWATSQMSTSRDPSRSQRTSFPIHVAQILWSPSISFSRSHPSQCLSPGFCATTSPTPTLTVHRSK